jgi:hypothetical protein
LGDSEAAFLEVVFDDRFLPEIQEVRARAEIWSKLEEFETLEICFHRILESQSVKTVGSHTMSAIISKLGKLSGLTMSEGSAVIEISSERLFGG